MSKMFNVCFQPRESPPNSVRMRSRSTSGGAGATAEGARLPPPLNSVASEPSLPQASVMLAQLLSAQHCQCTTRPIVPQTFAACGRRESRNDQKCHVVSLKTNLRVITFTQQIRYRFLINRYIDKQLTGQNVSK